MCARSSWTRTSTYCRRSSRSSPARAVWHVFDPSALFFQQADVGHVLNYILLSKESHWCGSLLITPQRRLLRPSSVARRNFALPLDGSQAPSSGFVWLVSALIFTSAKMVVLLGLRLSFYMQHRFPRRVCQLKNVLPTGRAICGAALAASDSSALGLVDLRAKLTWASCYFI